MSRVCRGSRGSHAQLRSRSLMLPCQPLQAILVVSHATRSSNPLGRALLPHRICTLVISSRTLAYRFDASQRIATTTASSDIELEDDFRSGTWGYRVALTSANSSGLAALRSFLVIGFLSLWGIEHNVVCGLTNEEDCL